MRRKRSPDDNRIGHYFTGSYKTKAIGRSMDNVLASKIGKAAYEAGGMPAGDHIDRGLALVRMLRKAGFEVRIAESGQGMSGEAQE